MGQKSLKNTCSLAINRRASPEYTQALHDWIEMNSVPDKELFSCSSKKIQGQDRPKNVRFGPKMHKNTCSLAINRRESREYIQDIHDWIDMNSVPNKELFSCSSKKIQGNYRLKTPVLGPKCLKNTCSLAINRRESREYIQDLHDWIDMNSVPNKELFSCSSKKIKGHCRPKNARFGPKMHKNTCSLAINRRGSREYTQAIHDRIEMNNVPKRMVLMQFAENARSLPPKNAHLSPNASK